MITLLKSIDVELDSIKSVIEIMVKQPVKTEFDIVGKTFSLHANISNNSILYASGLLVSRLNGAMALDNKELIDMCQKDIDELKKSYTHMLELKELDRKYNEFMDLKYECRSLLSTEEKAQMFKEKASHQLKVTELDEPLFEL